MNLKDITWDDGKYSCYVGRLGSRKVASMSYSMARNDPKPWKLTVEALGSIIKGQYVTREEAMVRVQPVLERILKDLFQDEPEDILKPCSHASSSPSPGTPS